jgi:hypothetical protein
MAADGETAAENWIFVSNPNKYKIDTLMRERLSKDNSDVWSVRDSDDGFAHGQLGVVRVGRDVRNKNKLASAGSSQKLDPGVYAVCEVTGPRERVTGPRKNDDLWYDDARPNYPRLVVPIKYIWWSYPDKLPLLLSTLEELRSDFAEQPILKGYSLQRGGSFPLASDVFWLVVDHLFGAAEAIAAHGTADAQERLRRSGIPNYEAEEGYAQDQKKTFRSRNSQIIEERKKRDNYTCTVCHFRMKVNGTFIIDCHHLYPLHGGERVTQIDDLVSLCPSCHRIAHSKKSPLAVSEIRAHRKAAGLPDFEPHDK